MGLVLASTSPYRKQLLDRLGLPFIQMSPRCDEELLKKTPYPGAAGLARMLATEKVNSLIPESALDTIIGGDQVVELDGRFLDKPGTVERAVEQLTELSGRSHRLATAVAVWDEGRLMTHVDITTLTMRTLELSAIERYVEADQPLDCAGSYKLESRGITLFERIETADYTAIIGMPLMALTSQLRSIGYIIP
jgi:septum formation protein